MDIIEMQRDVTKPEDQVDLRQLMGQIAQAMQTLAAGQSAAAERMDALERKVAQLEKVTPAQANELTAAIRDRAAAVCSEYRVNNGEKPVASAIRKAVRLETGTRNMREIARCDYRIVMGLIEDWDDLRVIRKIRDGGRD